MIEQGKLRGSSGKLFRILEQQPEGTLLPSDQVALIIGKPRKQVRGLFKWACSRGVFEAAVVGGVLHYGLPGALAASGVALDQTRAKHFDTDVDDFVLRPFEHRLVSAVGLPMPPTTAVASVFHLGQTMGGV